MQNDYRYERKFSVSGWSRHKIETIIKLHPAMFSQAYEPRYVNSIYYDDHNFASYFDTIEGAASRTKVRVRWYGELFGKIDRPVLEFKIKQGLLGCKKNYPLTPFMLAQNSNRTNFCQIFDDANISESDKLRLSRLKPNFLGRYLRQYYLSADRNYRITLDTEVQYRGIDAIGNATICPYQDRSDYVLEIKYDSDHDSRASEITSHFPFRMTKNSKYQKGIERVWVK